MLDPTAIEVLEAGRAEPLVAGSEEVVGLPIARRVNILARLEVGLQVGDQRRRQRRFELLVNSSLVVVVGASESPWKHDAERPLRYALKQRHIGAEEGTEGVRPWRRGEVEDDDAAVGLDADREVVGKRNGGQGSAAAFSTGVVSHWSAGVERMASSRITRSRARRGDTGRR